MPRESIYLPEELAKGVELKAKEERIPFSRVVQKAIARFLEKDKTEKAKTDILFILSKKPLGMPWKELHKERTESDVDRD